MQQANIVAMFRPGAARRAPAPGGGGGAAPAGGENTPGTAAATEAAIAASLAEAAGGITPGAEAQIAQVAAAEAADRQTIYNNLLQRYRAITRDRIPHEIFPAVIGLLEEIRVAGNNPATPTETLRRYLRDLDRVLLVIERKRITNRAMNAPAIAAGTEIDSYNLEKYTTAETRVNGQPERPRRPVRLEIGFTPALLQRIYGLYVTNAPNESFFNFTAKRVAVGEGGFDRTPLRFLRRDADGIPVFGSRFENADIEQMVEPRLEWIIRNQFDQQVATLPFIERETIPQFINRVQDIYRNNTYHLIYNTQGGSLSLIDGIRQLRPFKKLQIIQPAAGVYNIRTFPELHSPAFTTYGVDILPNISLTKSEIAVGAAIPTVTAETLRRIISGHTHPTRILSLRAYQDIHGLSQPFDLLPPSTGDFNFLLFRNIPFHLVWAPECLYFMKNLYLPYPGDVAWADIQTQCNALHNTLDLLNNANIIRNNFPDIWGRLTYGLNPADLATFMDHTGRITNTNAPHYRTYKQRKVIEFVALANIILAGHIQITVHYYVGNANGEIVDIDPKLSVTTTTPDSLLYPLLVTGQEEEEHVLPFDERFDIDPRMRPREFPTIVGPGLLGVNVERYIDVGAAAAAGGGGQQGGEYRRTRKHKRRVSKKKQSLKRKSKK